MVLAIPADPHSGGRVFPIPELTDEMLARIRFDDGSVDEWYDLIGEPTMTLLDFQAPYSNLFPDPSNLDFRIWLAWHDDPDRIYAGFVCSDDVYQNNYDPNADDYPSTQMDLHDSISLAIDGDHSGGEGAGNHTPPEEWGILEGQTQRYEAIARAAGGPTLNDAQTPSGEFAWRVFPPYGDGGGGVYGETPTISVIELFITPYDRWGGPNSGPEETAFSDLAAGQVIGFALIVYDREEKGWEWPQTWTPEAIQTEDPESDIIFLRADFYLDGLLLPANPNDPEQGTAVEPVAWGRIKAALESK